MSKLASIERVIEIKNHPNAESLEIAVVLGWKIVVKKGEFQVGDLAFYVRTDTIVDERPEYEFLRNKSWRVKPIRLRGETSEGLLLPLSAFPSFLWTNELIEGQEVSDFIGVKKYEKPVPPEMAGIVKFNNLPYCIPVTDEERLQNFPALIWELQGNPYFICTKNDGTSATYTFKDGQFDVCSRRQTLMESEKSVYWRVAHKYKLPDKLAKYSKNIAIRGEICGPGIQGNKLGLAEHELFVFDIYDIDNNKNYSIVERDTMILNMGLKSPTMIEHGRDFQHSIESLEKMANELKYENGKSAEGIVVRPQIEQRSAVMDTSRLSFKVISAKYAANE